MNTLLRISLFVCAAATAAAAVEEAIDSRFKAASDNAALGDWAGAGESRYVAQVIFDDHGDYQANLLRGFDAADNLVAVLRGQERAGRVTVKGGGWSGVIEGGRFQGSKGDERFDLQRVVRATPTLGAPPPAGAVILFDGKNLEAWANKKGKEWLVEDGPAPWKIVEGVLEVVPGTGGGIISHQKFGDCRLHLEFRTLGAPSNSGVFLQTRYEANINESYGKLEGTPNGGFDNCLPTGSGPKIRASRPPLVWQTFDIEFTAPRFDAVGNKTAPATATLLLNGVKLYDRQALESPHGAAGRLGEAPTGPLLLQEHGMPVQFRNIWLVPTAPKPGAHL